MAQRFPEFILEVEKILKKGGMSGAQQGEVMKMGKDSDLVKIGEGGEEELVREGSSSGRDVSQIVSMTMGPVCELKRMTVSGDTNCAVGPKVQELDTGVKMLTGDDPEQTVGECVRPLTPHTL
jgi:hypothetical protein